jgi:thiopurine S-methyltransferase
LNAESAGASLDYGPAHWETLYREGRMPWDAGGVPAEFSDYLARHPGPGRALVPGCGSAYEAAALAAAGFDTLALDFSPAAVERARDVTHGSGARVEVGDFFTVDEAKFDLIFERAFLCALPPELRDDWMRQAARLLAPGGQLVGLFFLRDTQGEGPPFGMEAAALDALLTPDFERIDDRPSSAPLPVFGDGERWQVWQRISRD